MKTWLPIVVGLCFVMQGALAQEEEPTLEEIREYCADSAQSDGIPEEELAEYIADCIEIEADSYGVEYSPQEAE